MFNPNIEPQLCTQGSDIDLKNLEGKFVAQEKLDGHRAIMFIKDGKNHFYSRRTSDVTGEKEENTDRLPYLRDEKSNLEDCIFDGELIAIGLTDSSKVQHILGSTPERAKEMWDEGFKLQYAIFDVIRWRGEDVSNKPLYERIQILDSAKQFLKNKDLFKFPDYYYDQNFKDGEYRCTISPFNQVESYDKLLNFFYEGGSEGIVLKDINSTYSFKRNKDWKKFKKVNTADLVILGFVPPKKEYTGKFTKDELLERGWEYWEDGEPVSKTYAKNWVAGIICGAYKKDEGYKKVCVVKGFSDEVQEKIRTGTLGTVVVEVAFQEIINQETKSLRHPRVKCFRYDKKEKDCLWENI